MGLNLLTGLRRAKVVGKAEREKNKLCLFEFEALRVFGLRKKREGCFWSTFRVLLVETEGPNRGVPCEFGAHSFSDWGTCAGMFLLGFRVCVLNACAQEQREDKLEGNLKGAWSWRGARATASLPSFDVTSEADGAA